MGRKPLVIVADPEHRREVGIKKLKIFPTAVFPLPLQHPNFIRKVSSLPGKYMMYINYDLIAHTKQALSFPN